VFDLDAASVGGLGLAQAAIDEGQRPASLLPRGVIDAVLVAKSEEIAHLLAAHLQSGFEISAPEVILASKTRGRRPLTVMSVWERIAYRALVARVEEDLPAAERGNDVYEVFKRAPTESGAGSFVVMSDVASCYQYIDHGLLESELVAQTGDGQVAGAIRELLGSLMGHSFGLPQNRHPSHVLAETVLSIVDRRLGRRSIQMWRYNDDYRFLAASRTAAHEDLETLDAELRELGLVINEEKTSIRSLEKYETWTDAVPDRIARVEATFDFDFADFVLFASEYDDEPESDDPLDPDSEEGDVDDSVQDATALALLMDWRTELENLNLRARFGPDAVVDRQIVAASLRALSRTNSTGGLDYCRAILDSDPSLTPNVSRYLTRMMVHDEARGDGVLEELLEAPELYVSPWQAIWLMEPLRRSHGLTSAQSSWLNLCFRSPLHFLGASAADVLAVNNAVEASDLLGAFGAAPLGSRPKLVAAIATLEQNLAGPALTNATDGRPLYRWVAEVTLDE
jgi:hypothetical protein